MIAKFNHQLLAAILSVLLVITAPELMAQQPQGAPPPESSNTGQGVPLTEQELNNLVSPIALYPDSLVAQVLAASTFPDYQQKQSTISITM